MNLNDILNRKKQATRSLKEGASDYVGNAIEDLRVSKPGLDRETFLDELYSYLDAEYGKRVADMSMDHSKDDVYDEWYANYSDMAEGNSGQQEVTEGAPAGMVRFVLDSERAYEAVIARFGDLVEFDANEYMMVPERVWPKVEQVAHDADGIGAENVDDSGKENPEHYGVTEGDSAELYGLRVGDTVKADIKGKQVQGDVIDIFPESMEVELLLRGQYAGKTVRVDVRDTESLDESVKSDLRDAIIGIFQTINDGANAGNNMIDVIADELGSYFDDVRRSGDKDLKKAYDYVSNKGADAEDNPALMAQIASKAIKFLQSQSKLSEVSLGNYREKAGKQKALAGMGAMFGRSPEERAKELATFKKRERGLDRVKARDETARKAEQERQLADLVARLPELKSEYAEMQRQYKALGGSNWQYADREQNLSDSERKARSMEGPMNNLWRQIQAAEKSKQQGVAEESLNETPTIDFIRGLISEFNKQMSGSPYYPMDYKNPGMRMWTRGDGSKYKDPGYIFIERDLKPEDVSKWKKAGAVEKFWKFLESKGARKIGDVSGEFGSDPHSPAVVLNKLVFVFNGVSIAWGSTSRLKNSNVWRQKQQGVAEGILGDREYNRVMPFVKRIAGEVNDYERDEFGEELWSLLDQKYGSKFAQSVLQDALDFYWNEYTALTGPGLDEASVYKKDQDLSNISTQELEAFVNKHWAGGIPTWGQGESVKRAMRELRRRQKQGVAEAAGLYGPFTVTINTGERPKSRTKTKKFRREDDAILWAQDWLEDFSQYPYASAEVTDPDGNVVWTTDEEDSPWAPAKQQGVAEGVAIVKQDYDLDQMVYVLDVDGKKVSFTYWDYEDDFNNPNIKDIYQQAQEQLGKKLSPEQVKAVARAVFKSFEQGVAEGGPFSYGAKKPRRGSVADLAAKKRKEQDKNYKPTEPKDQMVGTAKVTKGVAESYTGRETKDGTWRVFKDGKAVAVAGPFKSREEVSAWIKKQKQGVAEGEKKPHPETWHDVDKKLGKAVDKMSQAEKVKKGFAHPDTLKMKGVAEGLTPASPSKILRLIQRHHSDWFDTYGIGEVEDTVVDMAEMGQFYGMSAEDAVEMVGQELESMYGQQGVAEGTESSIEKKIQAKQDSLSLAREQRRARGQRQQGPREIKLQAEIDKLNTELTQLKKKGVDETIRKVDGDYRLVSHTGKNLGTYPTKAGAEKRERQVQYFKHANEDVQLSELSNKLLGDYKKAAGISARDLDKAGKYAKADKRFHGIVQATKKEFDNDLKNQKKEDVITQAADSTSPVGGTNEDVTESYIRSLKRAGYDIK